MPSYSYEVITDKNKKVKGKIQSDNKAKAIESLTSDGYHVIAINEEGFFSSDFSLEGIQKVKPKDLAYITRQLHIMLNSGIDLIKATELLKNQKLKKKLRDAISQISDDINRGKSLSESMSTMPEEFPELLVALVMSGEKSGSLEAVLEKMANHYQKEHKLRGKIMTAMIYPYILVFSMTAISIVMAYFVMPQFITFFTSSNIELPFVTKLMLGFSNVLINYWYVILAVIILFVIYFRRIIKTEEGKKAVHKLVLRVVGLRSVAISIVTARFSRTLATLVGSGLPLLDSLRITIPVLGNKVYQDSLREICNVVERGTLLSKALADNELYYPELMVNMIQIGEESGTLEESLSKTADYYEDEMDETIERALGLFVPGLILVMAALAMVLVGAIMMPILSLYDGLG